MAPRFIILIAATQLVLLPGLSDTAHSEGRHVKPLTAHRIISPRTINPLNPRLGLKRVLRTGVRFSNMRAPLHDRIYPYYRFPRPYAYQYSPFQPKKPAWSAERFHSDKKWGYKDAMPQTNPRLKQRSRNYRTRLRPSKMERSSRWLSRTRY